MPATDVSLKLTQKFGDPVRFIRIQRLAAESDAIVQGGYFTDGGKSGGGRELHRCLMRFLDETRAPRDREHLFVE